MRWKGRTNMTPFTVSAAAAFAMALSFSASAAGRKDINPYQNAGLNSANQPVVQRTDYVLDVAAGNGVSAQEQQRLSQWFQSLGLGYGDRIFVDEPGGYADPASRPDIARVAGAHGLLLSDSAPATAGSVQPGTVRVVVSRTTASVPGCPNWEDREINSRTQYTASNYGCATNSNLAAMIADPNDLVLGQTGSVTGNDADKAIKAYRDRELTGYKGELKAESTGGEK
jgi:pilus assembly protein CpaD